MKIKFKIKYLTIFGMICMGFLFFSCDADVEIDRSHDEILSQKPEIISFQPINASVLEEITIQGSFLNFVTKAYIGDVEAKITRRVNSEEIKIQVPPQASNGQIRLVTQAEQEAISVESVSVNYPEPVITSAIPAGSTVNENIVLEGDNMNVITKVTFGNSEGVIEYKEAQSIVVKTPNDINSPMNLKVWYYQSSGEVSMDLTNTYMINIPKPEVSAWPRIMSRYQDVTVTGENMNLVDSVFVGEFYAPMIAVSPNSLTFSPPVGLNTGYSEIILKYAEVEQIKKTEIPYINGEFQTYYDWDVNTEEDGDIDAVRDPIAFHQVNGDVPQPPLPEGTGYYRLEMGTATGSTIGRIRFQETSNNSTWQNVLNDGNFNNNPVLHLWVNTENTKPILKIYLGGSGNANRRELPGGNLNSGDDWRLIAIRLKDFIPGLNSSVNYFEFRLNTGSSATELPIIINLDWIIITDKVLTEFGAEDITDEFKPAG